MRRRSKLLDLNAAPGLHSKERNERDPWSVWEAVRPRIQSPPTTTDLLCLTGGAARSRYAPLLYADIEGLLIPGLAALGIQAELIRLPEAETAALPFLRGRKRARPIPVFAFAGEPVSTESLMDMETERGETGSLAQQDRECTLIRQGLVTDLLQTGVLCLLWRDAESGAQETPATEFRRLFTHMLNLRRAAAQGTRRAHIHSALRRWVVFAAAYPDRISTTDPLDASSHFHAAAFLKQAAGKQRDAISNRLRLAGERFSESEPESALSLLRDAVLREMHLPAMVYHALSLPVSLPLTDLERRELIYLARAGTRDLKVLSAQRLAPEHTSPEVRRTLEQLAYDLDPWVRAAAL
jgi:hypothetical protein